MEPDLRTALVRRGRVSAVPCPRSAAVAAGFSPSCPPAYAASELGLIAGTGMLVAYVPASPCCRRCYAAPSAGEAGSSAITGWLPSTFPVTPPHPDHLRGLRRRFAACLLISELRLQSRLNLRSPKTEIGRHRSRSAGIPPPGRTRSRCSHPPWPRPRRPTNWPAGPGLAQAAPSARRFIPPDQETSSP